MIIVLGNIYNSWRKYSKKIGTGEKKKTSLKLSASRWWTKK
jgi:hypothetical protein